MYHSRNEKWQTTPDGGNGTTKLRTNKNAQRKGNMQILRNIGSWHQQTNRDERKKKSLENEKATRNQIAGT